MTSDNLIFTDEDNSDLGKRCYLSAIKLLSHKDYSRFKLANKLRDRGHHDNVIEDTIDLLVEEKYLREDYYKEARIKGLLSKGYHPYLIFQKMDEERCPVTSEEVEKVLLEYDMSEDSILEDLILKKMRILDSLNISDESKKENKVIRFALSKGHQLGSIKRALNEITSQP